ncbi:hypothetical protein TSUD_230040 [Trifolium subterraneum]|uniref:Fungal lipase-like domain-containing protein n=1 Tax=Trifolium subterraneum TaxID=3900 RepID=A0A2Z6LJY6_TRISU|nr:hypothetical protein TSUD_230040 [Trifolium subterraneum]
MTTENDNFYLSGPSHLTYVNWDDAYHRKTVAASLVNGVYVLEKDRQKQRQGPGSLAFPWWTFFHFELFHTLVDDVDSSIFGAIYEFKPPPSMWNNTLHRSPCYVIAFRGTMIKLDSFLRDIELDLKILKHGLHGTSRSKIAIKNVRNMVDSVGSNSSNIWLAGHSLGSCIALHAGKTMAKSGIFIESFLFNPPFPSAPLDQIINSEELKQGIRFAGSVLRAGLGIAMNLDKKSSSYDSFSDLSAWIPSLIVNRSDYICSKYVEYFEHRRTMEEIGAGSIEKIATQNSVGSLMMSAFGKESEPVHLIPSAILTVNLTPQHDCIEAHRIAQWDHAYHRKSVAASLVKGVYVLEKDRQEQRKGPDSLACHWWEFFHFHLIDTLIDDVDSSIFGAIYEFKPQPSMCKDTLHRSPRYVIAFRGTTIKPKSVLRDMMLDLKILLHAFHGTSRSKIATETVRNMVASVDGNGSNIWLAGHSLGSCIALHAGKTMAKSGIFIESFLFNPPFASAPINQMIKSEKRKHRIRIFGSVVKTGIDIFMNLDKKSSSYDSFAALSA